MLKNIFFTLFIFLIFENNLKAQDSILSYSNNSFQTTTNARTNGDYIRLPNLSPLFQSNGIHVGDTFTIQTWFRVTSLTRNWQRIFESGTPSGSTFLNTISIGVSGDGVSGNVWYGLGSTNKTSPTARVEVNTWYHIALVYNGTQAVLYLDGTRVIEPFTQTLTSNQQSTGLPLAYIGHSLLPQDSSTSGQFRDFRIYRIARTPEQIAADIRIQVLPNTPNLYYYLPLNQDNIGQTIDIANDTKIPNSSTAIGALRDSFSTVISQNNGTGAKYRYDSSLQRIYGTLNTVLATGEKIQYSFDSGSSVTSWRNVDTVIGRNWVATLRPSFQGGQIRVQSSLNTRTFTPYNVQYALSKLMYSQNGLDTVNGNNEFGYSVKPTIAGGADTFWISSGLVSGISIDSNLGIIRWNKKSLSRRSYTLEITAKNKFGSTTRNYTLILDTILSNFTYIPNVKTQSFGVADSSNTPSINYGINVPTYSIDSSINGISINASTGVIHWSATTLVGIYNIKVRASNNISTKLYISINN